MPVGESRGTAGADCPEAFWPTWSSIIKTIVARWGVHARSNLMGSCTGQEVRASGEALALAITGRKAVLSEPDGDAVAVLTQRMNA